MRKLLLASAALAVAGLMSPSSEAASPAAANMTVTATVEASCAVSANTLNFGSYAAATTGMPEHDGATTISVVCTNGTGYTVSLGVGGGSSASFATRKMSDGATNILNYTLYRDAGRAEIWGDGTDSSQTVTGTGTGAAQSIDVYGRIPSGQTPPPGIYTDTVVVSVAY